MPEMLPWWLSLPLAVVLWTVVAVVLRRERRQERKTR